MKKYLVFILLFLLPAMPAQAAVAFDSVVTTNWGTVGSHSFSFNNASGNAIVLNSNNNGSISISQTTVPTYDGSDLTFIQNPSPGDGGKGEQWYLVNPSTGSNTLVMTFDATAEAGTAGVMSFTGADTSDPIGVTFTESLGSGSSYSKAITTTADDSIVVSAIRVARTDPNFIATGTNQTKRFALTELGGSSQTTTAAGSYTTSWDFNSVGSRISAIFELKAEVSVAVVPVPLPIITNYE